MQLNYGGEGKEEEEGENGEEIKDPPEEEKRRELYCCVLRVITRSAALMTSTWEEYRELSLGLLRTRRKRRRRRWGRDLYLYLSSSSMHATQATVESHFKPTKDLRSWSDRVPFASFDRRRRSSLDHCIFFFFASAAIARTRTQLTILDHFRCVGGCIPFHIIRSFFCIDTRPRSKDGSHLSSKKGGALV